MVSLKILLACFMNNVEEILVIQIMKILELYFWENSGKIHMRIRVNQRFTYFQQVIAT